MAPVPEISPHERGQRERLTLALSLQVHTLCAQVGTLRNQSRQPPAVLMPQSLTFVVRMDNTHHLMWVQARPTVCDSFFHFGPVNWSVGAARVPKSAAPFSCLWVSWFTVTPTPEQCSPVLMAGHTRLPCGISQPARPSVNTRCGSGGNRALGAVDLDRGDRTQGLCGAPWGSSSASPHLGPSNKPTDFSEWLVETVNACDWGSWDHRHRIPSKRPSRVCLSMARRSSLHSFLLTKTR